MLMPSSQNDAAMQLYRIDCRGCSECKMQLWETKDYILKVRGTIGHYFGLGSYLNDMSKYNNILWIKKTRLPMSTSPFRRFQKNTASNTDRC